MNRLTPTNSLEFTTHRVNEVTVELNAEALRHIARDADYIIIRVPTVGPNGRPTSKTLRLHADQIKEPVIDYGSDDQFN